jgi:hypothetical protein
MPAPQSAEKYGTVCTSILKTTVPKFNVVSTANGGSAYKTHTGISCSITLFTHGNLSIMAKI